MSPSRLRGAFVGRQREIAELNAALMDAISGHGSLVVLVGEPGIGKTRTAQEFSVDAAGKNVRVLRGRCLEDIGPVPYWPWVQVLRAYVQDCVGSRLRSEMGTGATAIAEVVPEVREALHDLKMLPALGDPEHARLRLFDSITTFLKRASDAQPLVLVLDDLHWADRSSLLLLEFFAEELVDARILVLGTYQETEVSRGHPMHQTLGKLTKLPQFHRLSMAGLIEADVADFLQLVIGVSPQRSMVREIHSRTGGNPLFVTEVVRLLDQQRVLISGETTEYPRWDIGIPAGVREAISRRMDRHSQDCNRVLVIASVVGRQFGMEELERLVDGISDERLLDAVDEALSAGIIEELPGTSERYQFAHVLIQETLSSQLSSARQARLHARIAEVLEELWHDDLDSHSSELAHHFARAEVVLGPERVAKYSLAAGERALAGYAYEEALAHFQRGLAAKEGMPSHSASSGHASANPEPALSSPKGRAMDAETAALAFGMGRAQGALEQVPEAWVNLGRAFDFYLASRDVSRAIAVAEYPLFYVSGLNEVTRLTAQALKLVPADSLEAGRLFCRYGLLLNLEAADYRGAQEALAQALAIARREGDVDLEMKALANAADVHWYHLKWPDVVENAEQAIALARRMDDPHSEVWPLFFVFHHIWPLQMVPVNLGRAFDFYLASRDVSRAIAVAEYPLFYVSGLNEVTRLTAQALKLVPADSLEAGRLFCRYGLLLNLEAADYRGAQEALAQALAIARREGDVDLEMKALANAADVHWYHLKWPDVVENAEQAIALARRMDDPHSEVWPLFFAGTALWITGQIERASRYASDMLRQAERLGNRGLLANALLQSGTVCHVKGEWDKAREFYDRGMVVAPHWYMIIGFKLQLEYELGEFEAAGDYMKRLLEIVRDTPPGPTGEISYAAMLPPFAARITGNATRFDITLDAAETVLLSPSVTPMLASDVRCVSAGPSSSPGPPCGSRAK